MSLVTDLVGNFSGIELIWTALALLGVAVSVENGWEALRDLRALDSPTNGRRILAYGHVRREAIRIMVFGLYALIGIMAGLTPSRPGAQLSFVALILVFTSLALIVNSLLDRRDRRAL